MKTCIIANPNAGSADDSGGLAGSLLRLKHFTFRTTEAPEDAARFAAEAVREGYERIIAAGGDGTLNGVVNGMAENFAAARLGLIPLGTGNDFGRSIGLAPDPARAVDVLLAGRLREIDVVRVHNGGTSHFINVSGAGFTAEVGENLSGAAKSWWGGIAYVWAAARTLPSLREYQATLVLDDREKLEVSAYNILIANARYVGGGIPIAPQARLDDGQVDITIVPAMPATALLAVIPKILNWTHLDSPELIFRRAAKVHVCCYPDIPFNVDGEMVGSGPVTFETLPRVLRMIVGVEE
jgi:diacylglycerol kinase (ATP)